MAKGDTMMCPKCARPMEEGGECEPCADDREDHADLRTQFALALAANGGHGAITLYNLADALAREDARRRAEDAK